MYVKWQQQQKQQQQKSDDEMKENKRNNNNDNNSNEIRQVQRPRSGPYEQILLRPNRPNDRKTNPPTDRLADRRLA